ncbi:hypothetical protein PGN35_008600 [Nodosilinea sp. PGN35]|uniref:hypothetical protein n=1 Tax=Nodosilinea sp. PGN35 TaxID=3020489 RepID=UPI0023B2E8C7|nr:hypothetical protein [Nodosilinea sp. TSF1-S3]MDF0367961.1 hypothetical protein [Nodosilinea sp. TSF1-S3]
MSSKHNLSEQFDLDANTARTFQTRLKSYIHDLRTDITELSAGLKISRPVMIKFIHAEGHNILLPPITPAKVYGLWEELTKPEKIDSDKITKQYRRTPDDPENRSSEEIRARAIQNRQLLKERGPDELLIAAGYLPQQVKWIGISPERYPQLLQVAILLDNNLLDFDSFMQVTQRYFEEVVKTIGLHISADLKPSQTVADTLSKNPTLDPEFRNILAGKYSRACSRILWEGHRSNLSSTEALGLFSTILSNEVSRSERASLKLRVVNLDFRSVSFSLTQKIVSKFIGDDIRQASFLAEKELGIISSAEIKAGEMQFPPIIDSVITCSYSSPTAATQETRVIKFNYINCGTVIGTAIHAVALHLGLHNGLESLHIDPQALGSEVGALVKCTTSLGFKDSSTHVQGSWVDRDFMKTAIQSLLEAAEKWLFNRFHLNGIGEADHMKVVVELSCLQEKLKQTRGYFFNYQFLDEVKTLTTSKQITTAEKLSGIAQEAMVYLDTIIPKEDKFTLWSTLSIGLFRIYILAKLHELRLMTMHGKLDRARKTAKEIQKTFEEPVLETTLKPLLLFFTAEELLAELSMGRKPKLFQVGIAYWSQFVETAKDEINHFLAAGNTVPEQCLRFSCGPDIDVYQSLGTVHSIAGRWLFYLGKTKADLTQAYGYFLKASHYYSRIGFAQKSARCLALAGRVQVRLGDRDKVEELIGMARSLVEENLHIGQRAAFQQASLSEIHLLEGECSLLLDSRPDRGIISSLEGLKGALWLGLARRIADNLYNISRCAEQLGDSAIERELKDIFQVLWEPEENRTKKRKLTRLNPLNNAVASEVVNLLFDLKKQAAVRSWHQVAYQFNTCSGHIWDVWYREASKGDGGHHPIALLIRSGDFLKPIFKPPA